MMAADLDQVLRNPLWQSFDQSRLGRTSLAWSCSRRRHELAASLGDYDA